MLIVLILQKFFLLRQFHHGREVMSYRFVSCLIFANTGMSRKKVFWGRPAENSEKILTVDMMTLQDRYKIINCWILLNSEVFNYTPNFRMFESNDNNFQGGGYIMT